jgi:hypothetical protein
MSETLPSKLDLIWGVAAIADEIGLTERQAGYLIRNGNLPAKRIGPRYFIRRSELIEFCSGAGPVTPRRYRPRPPPNEGSPWAEA